MPCDPLLCAKLVVRAVITGFSAVSFYGEIIFSKSETIYRPRKQPEFSKGGTKKTQAI